MMYLDNAATTFPKPNSVLAAVKNAILLYGGNPGRSSHYLSREAARLIYECREEIASLFGGNPENVVFTQNATYALNIAINSLRRERGTILISNFEHNAVLRPVSALGKYSVFDARGNDEKVISEFKRAIELRPSLVVCNHMSNLCGKTLPVERIGAICKANNIPFIIDASQSAGRRMLTLDKCYADAICAPGHKGLYGIQGCGFVIFSDKYSTAAERLNTFIYGGNGVNSLERNMPEFLPERYEAGTLPTPSIASLCAGIKEVKRMNIDEIGYHESRLGKRLIEGLSIIKGSSVYGGEYGGGTVLFNIDGFTPERLAEKLDKQGICVRAGYHCCPLGHEALMSPEGGAVRASVSPFNNAIDIDKLLISLNKK